MSSTAIHVQLGGDYAAKVLADGPFAYWRLGDFEGYAQAVLSDAPVSYWRMDAAAGTTETDRTGGHNATYSGSFTLNQPGALSDGDASVDFGPSGAREASAGVVAAFSPTSGAFTIEAWGQLLRSFVSTTDYEVFTNENFQVSGLIMRLESNSPTAGTAGRLYVRTSQAGADTDAFTAFLSSLNIGLWAHLVWSYDGTNTRLYVNGVLAGGPTAMSSPVAATFNSRIGGFGQPFNGLLDEVAFYNYALDAQQIANHYALRTSTIATLAAATVADSSGNGHTGTISGGVTLQQPSLQPDGNAAALFDGNFGFVTMGNVAALAFTGAFSVEAWVKYTSAAGTAIAGKTNGSGGGWLLYINSNRLAVWAFTAGAVQIFNFVTPLSYNDGAYHHVVATWDGTTSANGVKIYIDGVFVVSATAAAGTPAVNSDPFVIGAYSASFVGTFPGTVDEVAAYNYALTAAQVLAHFRAGQWTDLSTDVLGVPIRGRRGFQSSSPDDLIAAPMTLQFSLDNWTSNRGGVVGYYSPDSPNLALGWQEGIRVRLQATANGNTRTRFIGRIETIAPTAGAFEDHIVAVTAASWLAHAAGAPVGTVSAQTNQRADQLLTALVALVPFQPPATSFATGLDVYPHALDDLDPIAGMVSDGINAVVRSGFDRVYEKADGTLVLETRQFRLTSVANTIVLTDTAAPALIAVSAQRSRVKGLNYFQITVHPRRTDASPVVLYALQISAATVPIPPGGSVTFQGAFADPTQTAQRVGGFNMLTSDGVGGSMIAASGALPVSDYDFGTAAGLTDLSASMTVSVVFASGLATFTITNPTMQAAYYTKLQCRGQGIYDYQTVTPIARDAAREALYGRSGIAMDCPYQPSPDFAAAAGLYLVSFYAPSKTYLDQGIQVFVLATDEVNLDALQQLEISSPIGVTEGVTGLAAGNFWINAIQEEYDGRGNAMFTLMLTPRDPNTYFTIDVSTIDGPDVLAAI